MCAARLRWWRQRSRCSRRWAPRTSGSIRQVHHDGRDSMTETQERSVPKPEFTDAEAGAKVFPDSTSRSYNYFKPAKRKQTHYEDVTVEVQPDPRHYLAQGWLYG